MKKNMKAAIYMGKENIKIKELPIEAMPYSLILQTQMMVCGVFVEDKLSNIFFETMQTLGKLFNFSSVVIV